MDKDKTVFLKQGDTLRFEGCSKLNAVYTPFLITDIKVEMSSHKDTHTAITKPIKLRK